MSETEADGLAGYAEGLYASESDVQRWVREETETRGFPLIQISPLEGRLLAVLARTIDARRLLEVGTLGGYSSLWLLSLLRPEAELVTLERSPEHAELAREAFERAGLAERVDLRVGDARETLAGLATVPPFDLAFIDADKESYPEYLERACELLRPGGLVLGDNAFWDGRVLEEGDEDPSVVGVREFNRCLAEDPRFEAVIVPVRDGLAVARFRG